jgi:tetratricopeptide (TPR) repeat protein
MRAHAARIIALTAVVSCLMRPAVSAAQDADLATLVAEAEHDASPQVRRADLAIPLFVRALDLAAASGDPGAAARIAVQLGAAYRSTHHVDAALRILERAIRLSRAAQEPAVESDALRMMGNVRSEDGENELAVGLYERGLAIAEKIGDDNQRIAILNALSVTARRQGKLPEALDLAHQALALLDTELARGRAVDAAPLFAVPFNVGKALSDAGDYGPALPYFERAFAAAEQHQMIAGIWHALFDTAEWYQAQGDLDRADDYYRRALVQSRRTESHDMEADTIRGLATIAEARGDVTEAISGYRTALDMYER